MILRWMLTLLALGCGLLAAMAIFQDIRADDMPVQPLGAFWFSMHPVSLQVSEAVISRYLDPCGLIPALGCAPFLWHPGISGLLLLPAGLSLTILALLLALAVKALKRRR